MAAKCACGAFNGVNFGVTGWIVLLQYGVVCNGDYLALANYARPKRSAVIFREMHRCVGYGALHVWSLRCEGGDHAV